MASELFEIATKYATGEEAVLSKQKYNKGMSGGVPMSSKARNLLGCPEPRVLPSHQGGTTKATSARVGMRMTVS